MLEEHFLLQRGSEYALVPLWFHLKMENAKAITLNTSPWSTNMDVIIAK